MKKNNLKIITALIFLVVAFHSRAQRPLPCGNSRINNAALNTALQFERSANRIEQVDFLVRVYFHVFHDNDGSQGAATLTQINSEFASLLVSYAADNICFLNAGIDSFDNTALNRNFNADTDPTGIALSPFQVPGCINIFYMRVINGTNNACNPPCGYGGIALGGIPGTFCLVSTGNIASANTIGHEVGHCLGLLHTFERNNGFEKIDGSNSATSADLITDTNADPFAYNGTACYSTSANGCTYTGNCQDPNQQTNFSPPYTNLMAYWAVRNGTNCVANPTASPGQFLRARSFLNTFQPLKDCSSVASLILPAATISSGYYMKSAISNVTTNGNLIINSSAIATIGGGTVNLKPGFRASPNIDGKVRIVVKPCN